MSLVSCFMGKCTWAERASNIEYELGQVMEEINDVTKYTSTLQDRLSQIETNETGIMNQISLMRSQSQYQQMASGIQGYGSSGTSGTQGQQQGFMNSMQGNNLLGMIRYLLSMFLMNRQQKAQVKAEERALHTYENQLQQKKNLLETQKKLADQNYESMQKMEEGAIKRFKVNV